MSIMNTIRDWRSARRTRFELSRLSDRSLHDMGIPKWRIDEVANGSPIDPRQVI